MSIDVDALLNLYQLAFLESRLVMNNKDALNKNATKEQATKSLAISASNTSDGSNETTNEQSSQAT